MKKLVVAACVVLGAALGTLAGSRVDAPAPSADDVRATKLRDEVGSLRDRFADVKRDLDAATTHDAATAARARLFQLRVDMVALEDEIVVLARRRAAAGE